MHKGNFKPVPLESAAQLVSVLDEGAAKTRAALWPRLPDDAWNDNWKLTMQGKSLFDGSRFLAYREMFLNHIVHHRAQLGVYLRLNEKKVPGDLWSFGGRHSWFLVWVWHAGEMEIAQAFAEGSELNSIIFADARRSVLRRQSYGLSRGLQVHQRT